MRALRNKRCEKQSGLAALCVEARRSLCRGPALSVDVGVKASGPLLTLCVSGPAISVSVPGALCVRPRRSLCWGPALCVWPRRSLCRAPVEAQRSLYRGSALTMSGPGAPRQGLCRGAAVLSSGRLCVGVGARVSGRRSVKVLCVGPHVGPGAVGARRSVSSLALCVEPGALCRVGARRSSPNTPCLAPVSVVSGGSQALSAVMSGPGGLCVGPCLPGPAFSVSGPALSVSGPGALCRTPAVCVVARQSLPRARSACRGPALWAALSVSGSGARVHLHRVWAFNSPTPICAPVLRASSSDPRATHSHSDLVGPRLRSSCHPSSPAIPHSDPRATHPFQGRTPNLNVWGKIEISIMTMVTTIRLLKQVV